MSNMQHRQSRRPALDERTHKINQRVMMRGLLGTVTRCEKGRFSGHGFVCWRSQAMSWEISKGDWTKSWMMWRAWLQGHTAREKLKFSAFGFVLWYLGRVSGIGISEALGVRSRSRLHSVAVDVSGQHCPRRVPAAGTTVADGRTAMPTSTMQLTPLHPSSLLMFVHLASPLFLKRQEICVLHSQW